VESGLLPLTAAAWVPDKGIFGPTTGMDPRLFDGIELRPEVRAAIMEKLDQALRVDGGATGSDWQLWTRVYLAGGSASEWAGNRPNETAQDLDILIGVDYSAARGHAFEGMDDDQITTSLNATLRAQFNEPGWEAPFGGYWEVTGYVNPRAWDIAGLKPYAAYNLTDMRWAVRPPHLPSHSADSFDRAILAEARAVAAMVRAILKIADPGVRRREAAALWETIHRNRDRAFSAEGDGWQDPGNVIEKWVAYAHGGLLDKIRELAYAGKTARLDTRILDTIVSMGVAAAERPLDVKEYGGTTGDSSHITRREDGWLPTSAVAHLPGAMGEVPGEHRNRKGEKWDSFKSDIAANGIKDPIFITVDHGKDPVISEGNHRRDAAVELGHSHVPVEVRYYGHAEQQGTVQSRAGGRHSDQRVRDHLRANQWCGQCSSDFPRGTWQQHAEENHKTAAGSDGDRFVTCSKGHEHWGAHGAAGLLLRHRDGEGPVRYLLQKRSSDVDHAGTWSIPSGARGKDESPEQGAEREFREEMGRLPQGSKHSHTVQSTNCGDWSFHTAVYDAPTTKLPRGYGETEHEVAGSGWFTPHEIKGLPLHPAFAKSWDTVRRSKGPVTASSRFPYTGLELRDDDHPKYPGERRITAQHPEHGQVGHLDYHHWPPSRRLGEYISMDHMEVSEAHRRRGVASQMMAHLESLHPGVPISHGDRSKAGKDWASSYYGGEPSSSRWTKDRSPFDSRTAVVMDSDEVTASVGSSGEKPYYYGTTHEHQPGDSIEHHYWPRSTPEQRENSPLYTTTDPSLAGHIADLRERQSHGQKPGRMYQVHPTGPLRPDEVANPAIKGATSWQTSHPLHVVREIPRHEWPEDLLSWQEPHNRHEAASDTTVCIVLDVPPELIHNVDESVDYPAHVTVVYCGKRLDEDGFEEVLRRAEDAARRQPGPLTGTLSGLDTFDPSNSSDGKVPAFIPANIPGIRVLHNRLADLSASDHKGYIPHVTLAYCEPGEELPPPHHAVPITFTHLTVRRGNHEEHRFPLGG
jgi:8-oxo-dGTP diphosphatase